MERFVTIVNGFQPLTIITKRFILVVAAALDPPLNCLSVQLAAIIRILFLGMYVKRENHCCLRNVCLPRIIQV